MKTYVINFVSESQDRYTHIVNLDRLPNTDDEWAKLIQAVNPSEWHAAQSEGIVGPGLAGTWLHLEASRVLAEGTPTLKFDT